MVDMDFEIIDENGKSITCTILHHFETNNQKYLIYTTNELDEDGSVSVTAARCIINGDNFKLEEIETDKEWDLIDKEWSTINENV